MSERQVVLIEKKSKFVGLLFEITSKEQVVEILENIKQQHKKATHICYAYKITNGQEIVKFSDDGEPNGTAGRPILNVIEKKNLTNILVVVVRYFGGIKLGAGGLCRAYTKCTSMLFGENDGNNRTN